MTYKALQAYYCQATIGGQLQYVLTKNIMYNIHLINCKLQSTFTVE